MAALVTAEQLASRLQSDLDTATATLAINGASGMVRSIARQQFDFVAQETVILAGGTRVLALPQRPVVVDGSNPLSTVESSGFGAPAVPLVDGRDFERAGDELVRAYPWYWSTNRMLGWPHRRNLGVWAPRVTVTYSHGYAVIPDDIQKIVLDIAAQMYDNPTLLRQHAIDDFSEQFAVEALGASTVDGIRAQLRTTGRRRGAHSIRLG